MSETTKQVPIILPNGTRAIFETSVPSQEADVAEGVTYGLDRVFDAIEGLAAAANATLSKVRPKRATLEVGLTTKLEAGTLVAVFVKGAGEATVKLTLEW